MPFDIRPDPPRVAIIGGGISGLSAALVLRAHARVTLYEAEPRLGGHARTALAGRRGDQPVDTGFIVFNHATYPHLGRLFRELGAPIERSDMSFGASLVSGGRRIEYALRDARGLFAQPRNLLSPAFLGMLRDILRFNARAEAAAREGETVGELVTRLGLGDAFRRLYLRPFCGAIWSSPGTEIDDFPAAPLVRFMRNHGLMDLTGQHQWWTVQGGSARYVELLARRLEAGGVVLRPGAPVRAVLRDPAGVSVLAAGAEPERFDRIVLACHPDQALRLLAEPGAEETRLLGAIRTRPNRAVLHADPGQMPARRACWSAWVYRGEAEERGPVGVTYWMNRLQNLPDGDPLFVTLNPSRPIRAGLIYDETEFRHPVFDRAAIRAQAEIGAIQGENRTWYAGAWLRNGFHEDGIASALRVARAMGMPAW